MKPKNQQAVLQVAFNGVTEWLKLRACPYLGHIFSCALYFFLYMRIQQSFNEDDSLVPVLI